MEKHPVPWSASDLAGYSAIYDRNGNLVSTFCGAEGIVVANRIESSMIAGCRCYVSGPMTGIESFNRPAFFAAEELLLAMGAASVYNPARHPDGLSWDDYMRLDLAGMRDCAVFVRLPGWESSRGARIENDLAVMGGMVVLDLSSLAPAASHAKPPVFAGFFS